MSLPVVTTSMPTIPLGCAVGGELHVVGRAKAPIAHLHDAGLCIGGARACILGLAAVAPLGRSHFRQPLQRGLDALFAFTRRAQLGGLGSPAGLARVNFGQRLERSHQLARLTKVFLQTGLPTQRGRPGVGPHPHSVLRNTLQRDGARVRHRGHVFGEHLVHQLVVGAAKIVQRVVVHVNAAADPAVRVVRRRQPRDLTPAAHTVQRGVQPQREQDARVDRRTPGNRTTRLDGIKQRAQVLAFDVAPDEPGAVVFSQQRLQVRCAQLDLLPIRLEYARRALATLFGSRLRRRLNVRGTGLRQVLEQSRFLACRGACGILDSRVRIGKSRKDPPGVLGVARFLRLCQRTTLVVVRRVDDRRRRAQLRIGHALVEVANRHCVPRRVVCAVRTSTRSPSFARRPRVPDVSGSAP